MYLSRGARVPARWQELVAGDSTTVINSLGSSGEQICDHLSPNHIPVALHNRVSAAKLHGFIGIQRGVDAAVHYVGAAFAGDFPQFHAAQRITRVDADSDDIAGLECSPAEMAPESRR